MKNLIENKYPYALALFVGTILFTALVLEGNSHNQDNQHHRAQNTKLYNENNELCQELFKKDVKIEELQGTIDSLHVFDKRSK